MSAITVSILHMRRDGIIFTPNISDKQYYTSERLNRIVLALTTAYNKQYRIYQALQFNRVSSHNNFSNIINV